MSRTRAPHSARIDPDANVLTTLELGGIRRLTALDTVRARIAMAVDLGLLKPGERLPTNRDIAVALGVGEITVRRALVALDELGVLERRRGRGGGTWVASEPPRGAVVEVDAYSAAVADVRRLIDQRVLLECGIVHLAALCAKPDSIWRLGEFVDQMDRAESWAAFHVADERFHLEMALATDVPGASDNLAEVLDELYRHFLPYPMEYLRQSNEEHEAILDAVERHDPITSVGLLRRHVEALHRTTYAGLLSNPSQIATTADAG